VPGPFAAQHPYPRRFRRLLSGAAPASQPGCLRLYGPSNGLVRFGSHCSALHRPMTATMASADFCGSIPTPLDVGSTQAEPQISRGKARDCRSMYLRHIRVRDPGDIGLRISLPPRPSRARLLCRSYSSGQSFACSFLPTSPHGRCSCCSARGSCHQGPQRTFTSKSLPGSLSLPVPGPRPRPPRPARPPTRAAG
jgi:hypothetical protein